VAVYVPRKVSKPPAEIGSVKRESAGDSKMQNAIQPGNTVAATAPYARVSGEGALVGSIFGVACLDVASGAVGQFELRGVFDLARATGASSAWTEGSDIYWDNVAKVVTKIGTGGNLRIGVGVLPLPTDSDARGRVRLNVDSVSGASVGASIFVSTEQTGTGSSQSIAHGLGVIPSKVFVTPTDTAPSVTGVFTVTEGSHTSTNALVTVTSGKKYKLIAIV
jgi:predicted RecA/RadA family phage recombinase